MKKTTIVLCSLEHTTVLDIFIRKSERYLWSSHQHLFIVLDLIKPNSCFMYSMRTIKNF